MAQSSHDKLDLVEIGGYKYLYGIVDRRGMKGYAPKVSMTMGRLDENGKKVAYEYFEVLFERTYSNSKEAVVGAVEFGKQSLTYWTGWTMTKKVHNRLFGLRRQVLVPDKQGNFMVVLSEVAILDPDECGGGPSPWATRQPGETNDALRQRGWKLYMDCLQQGYEAKPLWGEEADCLLVEGRKALHWRLLKLYESDPSYFRI